MLGDETVLSLVGMTRVAELAGPGALRGAWPILGSAERVEVLMVDPPPEAEAFLSRRLEHRGVEARIAVDRASDAKAGELNRSHAEDLVADRW